MGTLSSISHNSAPNAHHVLILLSQTEQMEAHLQIFTIVWINFRWSFHSTFDILL